MKKLSILAILTFAFVACEKNLEVDKKQTSPLQYDKNLSPVLFEITSTGCPGCGGWGKPTFESIVKENEGTIVPLAIHVKYSDPMITDISNAIEKNIYGSRYTPQIWVNDTNGVILVGNGISGEGSIKRINDLLNRSKSSSFNIKIDGNLFRNGNEMTVKYGMKQTEVKSDSLYLACYLLENDLVFSQNGYASNPAKHNFVIRAANEGNFGFNITQMHNAGETKEYETSFQLKNATGNYHVALVVWKKSKERFSCLGGISIK